MDKEDEGQVDGWGGVRRGEVEVVVVKFYKEGMSRVVWVEKQAWWRGYRRRGCGDVVRWCRDTKRVFAFSSHLSQYRVKICGRGGVGRKER